MARRVLVNPHPSSDKIALLLYLILALFALLGLCTGSASAQVVVTDNSGITLTTSRATCVQPDSGLRTLALQSIPSNSVNILYCFRAAVATPCTPTNWTIPPGQTFFWSSGSAPTNGVDCAAASSTATVNVGLGH